MNTFVEVLESAAARWGTRMAFTFLDFEHDAQQAISYRVLHERATAIALALLRTARPGDRALLVYPSGIDFIEAYFGCLVAGVVAVPVPLPAAGRAGQQRLLEVLRSADPSLLLTVSKAGPLLDELPCKQLHTDRVESQPGHLTKVQVGLTCDSVAFLQYTSGSTSAPKGVVVTHRNLLANTQMIADAFQITSEDVCVHWLPLFHDMGLIGHTLATMRQGTPVYFMAPSAFLRRPSNWLKSIGRYGGTIAASPNFGYEYCVQRIKEAEKGSIDLSTWTRALNGAEPVAWQTLERFAEAFGACGFDMSYFRPCYGLAEATLLVSGVQGQGQARELALDAGESGPRASADLGAQEGGARRLASSGTVVAPGRVLIVHPERRVRCAHGEVGEIWVQGEHVARGYFRDREQTVSTFEAYLADGTGPFMRTGDLGVLRDRELIVTGRIKDLIVLRGANYYPQDLERSAEGLSRVCTTGVAAFAVSSSSGVSEAVALVVELERKAVNDESGLATLAGDIREAILSQHGVHVQDVCFVPRGAIPRTSSGKLRRQHARALYLSGAFHKGAPAAQAT